MFFKDYEPYGYGFRHGEVVDGTASIGWLDVSKNHATGKMPDTIFIESLRNLVIKWSVNEYRGIHYCNLCVDGDTWNEGFFLSEKDGTRHLLGMSEIWIPSIESNLVFVAPTLIYHYVVDHAYVPPKTSFKPSLWQRKSTKIGIREVRANE